MGDDSSFLLWLCHKKAPVLPECTGQGRELNFRGTTLLRRTLAGMALRAGVKPASAR